MVAAILRLNLRYFNGLGARTHLIYRSDLPLRGFDDDVRAHMATALTDRGIILHPETTIEQVTAENSGKQAHLSDGSRLVVDQIMAATGRRPNTANLGLDDLGVKLGKQGEIIVDNMSQTNLPSLYAIGDVTNRINLTPVAIAEGHAFADSEFGNLMPSRSCECCFGSFSQPPIASVGPSEGCKKAYSEIMVFESQFRAMKNTISGREEKTYMKPIVDKPTDSVAGVHMWGQIAGNHARHCDCG